MIVGDGPLARGVRAHHPEPKFTWVCYQPPLPELDVDSEYVLISTPILVGTTARLEKQHPDCQFAYLPENVREQHPEDWTTQVRHVVGTRHPEFAKELAEYFLPIPVLHMTPESAELVKHAINGFLAFSIEYAHIIARLAEENGADPYQVARGVMSDPRIGERAYLKPDGDLGPHLQREINNLHKLGADL